MKSIFALAVAALALSACVTNPGIPPSASAQIARICQAEPLAHLAFATIATQTALSPRLIAAEQAAHVAVTRICADPPVDALSALTSATAAYADVLAAQATAEEEI